jgi:hypothetical protein
MKKIILAVVVCLFLISISITNVRASESFLGVALFSPLQYPTPEDSIKGIRVNAIYAVNQDLTGIDFGLFIPFNFVRGDLKGIQFGAIYNCVEGQSEGIQWGLVNTTKGDLTGAQLGFVNFVDGKATGLQWGFYNQAGSLEGIQLGLININKSGDWITKTPQSPNFFPLINWGF